MKCKWLFALLLLPISTTLIWAKSGSDFNGDGTTDFRDFVLFASKFGSTQGEPNFDSRFDLDGNGEIGFEDFTTFAEQFGVDGVAAKQATTAEELEKTAKKYRDSGDTEKAIEKYEAFFKVASTDLQKARALSQLGGLNTKSDNLSKAEEYFIKGVRDLGDSEDKLIRAQVMWCVAGLGEIQFLKDSPGKAALYLRFARRFYPPVPSI